MILQHIPRSSSIRELAKVLKIDGQNLTRKLKSLEDLLEVTLIERSTRGISITEEGRRTAEVAEESLRILNKLRENSPKEYASRLRVCGRAYMTDYFIDSFHESFARDFPRIALDLMDESPEKSERAARSGLIDILFSFGEIDPGRNFETTLLTETKWEFVVRNDHGDVPKLVDEP